MKLYPNNLSKTLHLSAHWLAGLHTWQVFEIFRGQEEIVIEYKGAQCTVTPARNNRMKDVMLTTESTTQHTEQESLTLYRKGVGDVTQCKW